MLWVEFVCVAAGVLSSSSVLLHPDFFFFSQSTFVKGEKKKWLNTAVLDVVKWPASLL